MTIFLMVLCFLILLPGLGKLLLLYFAYLQWGLQVGPIKIKLQADQRQPQKKSAIGFPVPIITIDTPIVVGKNNK